MQGEVTRMSWHITAEATNHIYTIDESKRYFNLCEQLVIDLYGHCSMPILHTLTWASKSSLGNELSQ